MNNPQHILCIEDEVDIQEIMAYNLEKAGFTVSIADDGEKGFNMAQETLPDLILLDVMLPKLNGWQVCKKLKEDSKTSSIPVIMLSARSEEGDIINGLGLGADDYVTKPYSQAELIARIHVALRRHAKQPSKLLAIGVVEVDPEAFRCCVNGSQIKLTTTEFKLLHTLMLRPGKALSREQLILSALGEDSDVVDRNVDVHIRGVRKQLGSAAALIETIRGVGYRCNPEYTQKLATED
jgi:DNA-binding response OmpR family regulator